MQCKAAVVTKLGAPLEVKTVEIPKPKENEILLKSIVCGVCHTDLHAALGDWGSIAAKTPFIPGHELVGEVVELGPGVDSVKIGDFVGVPWFYAGCGKCNFCTEDDSKWETLCPNQLNAGFSANGGFSEYAIADARYVGHIPKNLSPEAAAPILCAGVTTYKGLKMMEAKPGDWIVVSGVGGLGHVAIQYAKTMGYKVIGIDIGDAKMELAKKSGAIHAVDASKVKDVGAEIHRLTDGGASGALVTAAGSAAVNAILPTLKRGGTAVVNSLPKQPATIDVVDLVLCAKTLRGSIVGTRKDLDEALKIAAEGKISSSYTFDKLDNINQIFDDLQHGRVVGRVILDFRKADSKL